MKVSLKWLSEYVDLAQSPAELARRLTLAVAEVESVETVGGGWDNVTVGLVVAVRPHPNADRLRLATVDAGAEPKTVVCGAPNLAVGQKIAFADVGAHLTDGHTGKPAVLKASVIRGVESSGMVCSERELGLSEEHEGILVLPADAPVGRPLSEYLGDTVFDLYSWPHRPDLMSMVGVAREVAALTGVALREPELAYAAEAGSIAGRLDVSIEAPDLCPRYIGALLEGVRIGPSPAWMQDRLLAAGMRPINNVVDVTNYVMLEMGQPLHAFDYDAVSEHRIIVRRARPGERLRTLDGEDRPLDDRMLLIADPQGPVALAGVMGGQASEVGPSTSRILLEAANFNGISIRATSTRLHLRSEASARFEKSIGPEVAERAARRAVQLLIETANAQAVDGFVDAYPRPWQAPVIGVGEDRIVRVLGVELEAARVEKSLTSLGFVVDRESEGGGYRVTVPYWRTDVRIADDVIEEVIRIVGYDAVPGTQLSGRLPAPASEPLYELRGRVQDLLAGMGMQEVITYSLVSEKMAASVDGGPEAQPVLTVVNPASIDHAVLRPSLRPSLLQTLAVNQRHFRGTLALFESARVYRPRPDDLPEEEEVLAGVLAGRRVDRWGSPTDEGVDFYDLKGVVDALAHGLRVPVAFRAAEVTGMVEARAAEVMSGNTVVGVAGQVDRGLASRFGLDMDAYLFEIPLAPLIPLLGTAPGYKPYSRFPAVEQDLAVVVDAAIEATAIGEIIRRGRFVVDVRPFDVYVGPPVPPDRKSIAFSVRYQAEDRTLTEDEVTRSRDRIVQQLERVLGARLREA